MLMVVISINTQERIRRMMDERGWSEYRLAKECGVSQSTISNIFNRNYQPSISSLESICRSFGITLSQFFAEGGLVELTEEQYDFFKRWSALSPEQKKLLSDLISQFK
jgi:transcriptional regulator with XRE-family HTH domain